MLRARAVVLLMNIIGFSIYLTTIKVAMRWMTWIRFALWCASRQQMEILHKIIITNKSKHKGLLSFF